MAAISAKCMTARPVAFTAPRAVRPVPRMVVKASAQKQSAAVSAGVSAALAASAIVPQIAQAGVTPSLSAFLNSIVAGGFVLLAIAGAVTVVSGFDPVKRD